MKRNHNVRVEGAGRAGAIAEILQTHVTEFVVEGVCSYVGV